MLTTNGLDAINKYLAGQGRDWAGTLAVGALSSASTTISSSALQYELARYPVTFKSYRNVGGINQIVLKATIDPTADFDVYEIGIFPAKVDTDTYVDNFKVTAFSEVTGASSNWFYGNGNAATLVSASPSPRSGAYSVVLPVTTSSATNTASTSNLNIDSSNYSESDTLSMMYYVSSSFSAASVTVAMGDSAVPQNVWSSSTVVLGPSTASTFYGLALPLQTKSASITDPIISASVTFNGSSGSVILDYLKFVQGYQLSPEFQLVSRTTSASLTVPLFSKQYSQPMDIEYYIQVT